jgi:hypothetical protein
VPSEHPYYYQRPGTMITHNRSYFRLPVSIDTFAGLRHGIHLGFEAAQAEKVCEIKRRKFAGNILKLTWNKEKSGRGSHTYHSISPILLCGQGRRVGDDVRVATRTMALWDFNARLPCPWDEDLPSRSSCQGAVGLLARVWWSIAVFALSEECVCANCPC